VVATAFGRAFKLDGLVTRTTTVAIFAKNKDSIMDAIAERLQELLTAVRSNGWCVLKVGRTSEARLQTRIKGYYSDWDVKEKDKDFANKCMVIFHKLVVHGDAATASTINTVLEAWLHLLLPACSSADVAAVHKPYSGGGVGKPVGTQLLYIIIGKPPSKFSQSATLRYTFTTGKAGAGGDTTDEGEESTTDGLTADEEAALLAEAEEEAYDAAAALREMLLALPDDARGRVMAPLILTEGGAGGGGAAAKVTTPARGK
jgi:hypothetical protein